MEHYEHNCMEKVRNKLLLIFTTFFIFYGYGVMKAHSGTNGTDTIATLSFKNRYGLSWGISVEESIRHKYSYKQYLDSVSSKLEQLSHQEDIATMYLLSIDLPPCLITDISRRYKGLRGKSLTKALSKYILNSRFRIYIDNLVNKYSLRIEDVEIGHVVKTNKKDFLMRTYKYNMEEDNIPHYLLEFYPTFLLRPL